MNKGQYSGQIAIPFTILTLHGPGVPYNTDTTSTFDFIRATMGYSPGSVVQRGKNSTSRYIPRLITTLVSVRFVFMVIGTFDSSHIISPSLIRHDPRFIIAHCKQTLVPKLMWGQIQAPMAVLNTTFSRRLYYYSSLSASDGTRLVRPILSRQNLENSNEQAWNARMRSDRSADSFRSFSNATVHTTLHTQNRDLSIHNDDRETNERARRENSYLI
jgi:hypothetical protein